MVFGHVFVDFGGRSRAGYLIFVIYGTCVGWLVVAGYRAGFGLLFAACLGLGW